MGNGRIFATSEKLDRPARNAYLAKVIQMYMLDKTLMQTSMPHIAILLAEGMKQKTFPREF
jgi:hypothetical protein